MPHLHIHIEAELNVAGIDTPVNVPEIVIPINDAEATAAALGLSAVDANDPHPGDGVAEVAYHSPAMKVKVARIFGRDINVTGEVDADAKVSITND